MKNVWILHDDGPCPLAPNTLCRVKNGDWESSSFLSAGGWAWERDPSDIYHEPMWYMLADDDSAGDAA